MFHVVLKFLMTLSFLIEKFKLGTFEELTPYAGAGAARQGASVYGCREFSTTLPRCAG